MAICFMGVKRRGGVFIIFKFTQKINEAPPNCCESIGWQLYAGSQTEEHIPKLGRPVDLPRTTAIKRNAGEVCQNCCLTV
ncbi:hypothetical protein D3C75_1163320 [compost metagenome]